MAAQDYPSDSELDTIKRWTMGQGWYALFDYVRHAWNNTYGDVIETDQGKSVVFTFITGGWSGNEDLLGALQDNSMLWLLTWQASHRGGKVIFEIDKEVGKAV